jgi:FAD-dependent urate hydroxylase
MAVNKFRVAIVGAGIGGLAAHLACRQAGFTIEHFERQQPLGPAGAGMILWPNGVKVLRGLGLGKRIEQIGCTPDRLVVRSNQDEILKEFPFGDLNRRLGAPGYVVSRTDLQAALLEAVNAGVVRTGANCVGVEQTTEGAVALFADGRRAAAELVVGADGIHSMVRRAIVGEVTPRYAGFATWVGIVASGGLTPADAATEYLGEGQRCALLPLSENRVYYSFAAAREKGTEKPAGGWRLYLEKLFADWPQPVHDTIARQGQDPTCLEIHDLPALSQWTSGRAALLGDAAHASTPMLGQAACQALEDAAWLGHCLADLSGGIAEALLHYEWVRKDRAEGVVALARKGAERMQAPAPDLYRSIRASSVAETIKVAERWLSQGPMG